MSAVQPPIPAPSTDPRPYVILGLVVVLAMFGGLGTWAAVAPLAGAVIAPGEVSVSSHRKTVQHLEGGIVAEIGIRDGDTVERGQLLIRLDATRARAKLAIVVGQLRLMRARESRLVAERDGAEAIAFHPELLSQESDPVMAEILDGQRQLFAARRAALLGEIEILEQRTGQFREEIGGLEGLKRARERELAIIQDELAGLRALHQQGFAPLQRIRELERMAEQLEGERGEHTADIARAQNGIAEARLQILQLEKDTRESVVAELHEVQATVFDLAERRVAALDELQRLEIRAPLRGTIVGLSVHTVGGVVAPGEPVLQIVPEDDELVIRARVQPQDIDKVSIGHSARVRLTAFDLRSTPQLTGQVEVVSADRMTDPATGSTYFEVLTRIPESELDTLDGLRLVPGMPAETFIETGERTPLSYLLKPLSDGFARAFRD